MKKTLCMVFFLAVLAGTAGCGEKNNADTIEQTDTQTEKTLEEHFFLAEQDEQNYNVLEEYSEDDEYPELAAFLTEYYQIPEEECKETRYYYNYIDLNEDGTDEIVAVTIGDTVSDTRGDVALILRLGENGQFEVLGAFSEIHTPVMISDELENDWHKIIFPIYGGGQESGFISAVYTEGMGYELDEESFVREEPKVSGERILSDNLINDMDTDNYLTLVPRDTESQN